MSIYIHTKIGMVPKLEVLEGQTTFVERERESERERIKRIYRKARIEGGPLVRWQEETQCNNLSLSLSILPLKTFNLPNSGTFLNLFKQTKNIGIE